LCPVGRCAAAESVGGLGHPDGETSGRYVTDQAEQPGGTEGQTERVKLHDWLRALPEAGRRTVHVPARNGQPARTATVGVAWIPVRVLPPRHNSLHPVSTKPGEDQFGAIHAISPFNLGTSSRKTPPKGRPGFRSFSSFRQPHPELPVILGTPTHPIILKWAIFPQPTSSIPATRPQRPKTPLAHRLLIPSPVGRWKTHTNTKRSLP